jgi:hypothetical protein
MHGTHALVLSPAREDQLLAVSAHRQVQMDTPCGSRVLADEGLEIAGGRHGFRLRPGPQHQIQDRRCQRAGTRAGRGVLEHRDGEFLLGHPGQVG